MKNKIAEGNTINLVAAAAIVAGQIVSLTNRVAVAVSSAAIGDTYAASLEGVYEYTAETHATDQAWVQGVTPIYYDVSENKLTVTASGNIPAGFAFADKASTAAVGQARLTP